MATLIINNQPLPASGMHVYYVVMEVAKLLCLFIFGVRIIKNKIQL